MDLSAFKAGFIKKTMRPWVPTKVFENKQR